MKQNKSWLITIPIALIALYFLFSENEKQTNLISKDSQAPFNFSTIKKVLQKGISKSKIEEPEFLFGKVENPYEKDIWETHEDFYDDLIVRIKKKPREYFRAGQAVATPLIECLTKKDLCGQKKKLKEGDFFDPHITPAHHVLEKALEVMNYALKEDIYLWEQVKTEKMIQALKIPNNNIPIVASQILLFYGVIPKKTLTRMIRLSKNMGRYSKPVFFSMLAQTPYVKDKGTRKVFLDSFYMSLQDEENLDLAMSLPGKIYRMRLSQKEFKKAVQSTCWLKRYNKLRRDKEPFLGYIKVQKALRKQARRLGYKLKVEKICA